MIEINNEPKKIIIRTCRICSIKANASNSKHWHKGCCSQKCLNVSRSLKRNRFERHISKSKKLAKNNSEIKIIKSDGLIKSEYSFYSSKEWRILRYEAFKKYGRSCALCGRDKINNGITLHVDHIKPRSKFPHLALCISNMQILCSDCNIGKSNRHFDDWRHV